MLPVSVAIETSFNLSYDPNGNLIQDTDKSYEYNGLNQLIKLRENNQNGRILEEYSYDYNGDRIEKVSYGENNAATITYYVDENFIRVVNSSGTFDTKFYYNNGQLIARQDPDGKKYYYHPDHLGSTNIVTDQNGNVVEETSYEPFGAVLEGGESRFLFTGKEKDPTGLYYYGARYYSPSLMKFTQPDTILQDVYDPQSLNRYSYVRNNPLKYTDPSGHILDTFLDLGFIAWDIWDIIWKPKSLTNWGALGADVAAFFVPFVTGAGRAIKIATKADDVIKAARAVDKAKDVKKLFKAADKANDAVKTMKEGGKIVDIGKNGRKYTRTANDMEYGKDIKGALDDAFKKTGIDPQKDITKTEFGRNGKQYPVLWENAEGAKVNVDFGHINNGPVKPHVGWETAGKRNIGEGMRGHNILDVNPKAARNLNEYEEHFWDILGGQ